MLLLLIPELDKFPRGAACHARLSDPPDGVRGLLPGVQIWIGHAGQADTMRLRRAYLKLLSSNEVSWRMCNGVGCHYRFGCAGWCFVHGRIRGISA